MRRHVNLPIVVAVLIWAVAALLLAGGGFASLPVAIVLASPLPSLVVVDELRSGGGQRGRSQAAAGGRSTRQLQQAR